MNEETNVSIIIYNLLGSEVIELINETKPIGNHIVYWNGGDDYGQKVSSGIYIYKIITQSGLSLSKKMVFLK